MIHDDVLDASLSYIVNNVENLYICSAEPTTFLEASSTYALGVKAAPSITGPSAGSVSGRKIVIDAITDGVIIDTGWIYYVALTDNSESKLLLVRPVDVAREITTQTVFTTASLTFELPGLV